MQLHQHIIMLSYSSTTRVFRLLLISIFLLFVFVFVFCFCFKNGEDMQCLLKMVIEVLSSRGLNHLPCFSFSSWQLPSVTLVAPGMLTLQCSTQSLIHSVHVPLSDKSEESWSLVSSAGHAFEMQGLLQPGGVLMVLFPVCSGSSLWFIFCSSH